MARGRKNADLLLATALACGATVEQAAQRAQVSVRTAYRRRADPAFQEQVTQIQAEMMQRAAAALTAGLLDDVKTLMALQQSDHPPTVRLGATRTKLEWALKLRDRVSFEPRLAALEKQERENHAASPSGPAGTPGAPV